MTALSNNVPHTMRFIDCAGAGGPDVLQLANGPVPQPGAGEVLIQVAYAGVNRPDVIQRLGMYPPPSGASKVLGLEVSGRIVAAGKDVDRTIIGSHVAALTPGGGYAEYCVAPAGHCLPVGEGMPLAEAAAIPETLFTVWHNVFQRGWAKQGETLLVHGGTSGIGTMAIMLAKSFGMQVIVTCGSDPKCKAAQKFGADHTINYRESDFVEGVQKITQGNGVEIILDMVSGDYVPRNLKCLADEGRHVTIAVLGGTNADLNMADIMRRRLTLTGSTLRARSVSFKTLLAEEIQREAWPLFLDGQICPVMDQIFPLAEAAAAHKRMELSEHLGKIVLEVTQI